MQPALQRPKPLTLSGQINSSALTQLCFTAYSTPGTAVVAALMLPIQPPWTSPKSLLLFKSSATA